MTEQKEIIVERVIRPDGKAVRRLYGTFVFELAEDDQRHGELKLSISSGGGLYEVPPVYNFYDTLNEITRREPSSADALAQLISEINVSERTSAATYQRAYDEHMEKTYPGWKAKAERAKPGGRDAPTEHVKTQAKLEDLDL